MHDSFNMAFGLIFILMKLKMGILRVVKIINQLLRSQKYYDDLHIFKVRVEYAFNRRLLLLIQQNDPEYEEDIKLFLGEVLELENSSHYLDLEGFSKAQLQRWRQQARNAVKSKERYEKAMREHSHLAESKLLHYLSMSRAKAIIEPLYAVVSIIKYIYNSGGLKGERTAHN